MILDMAELPGAGINDSTLAEMRTPAYTNRLQQVSMHGSLNLTRSELHLMLNYMERPRCHIASPALAPHAHTSCQQAIIHLPLVFWHGSLYTKPLVLTGLVLQGDVACMHAIEVRPLVASLDSGGLVRCVAVPVSCNQLLAYSTQL